MTADLTEDNISICRVCLMAYEKGKGCPNTALHLDGGITVMERKLSYARDALQVVLNGLLDAIRETTLHRRDAAAFGPTGKITILDEMLRIYKQQSDLLETILKHIR